MTGGVCAQFEGGKMGAWKDVPANTPVQRIVSGLQQYSALGYDKVCWLSQTCQLILPLLCIGGRGATGRRNSKPWSATPEYTRGHRFLPPRDSPPRPSRRLIQALAGAQRHRSPRHCHCPRRRTPPRWWHSVDSDHLGWTAGPGRAGAVGAWSRATEEVRRRCVARSEHRRGAG